MMRLDKYLCDALNISRSDAKKAIAKGRVWVDGQAAGSGSMQVAEKNDVRLDQTPVCYQRYYYIMLYKPAGYICANRDLRSQTVFDLLPVSYRKKDLFVCGRLDKDTTGLVLITNNGMLAHRLLAPKKTVFKEYLVTLRDKVSKEDIAQLQAGLTLQSGMHFKPAFFDRETDCSGILRISEGKYHQIKRMFAALGNQVVALHRRSIHGLSLDPALKPGECRYLTVSEIYALEQVK